MARKHSQRAARSRRAPRQVMLLIPPYRTGVRQMLAGIARYANERTNWTLMSGQIFNLSREVPPDWRGHGIITDSSLTSTYHSMAAAGVPIVNVRHGHDGPAVLTNREQVGVLAARHLMSLGLSQFAFFGKSKAKARRLHAGTFELRLGYGEHLSAHGYSFSESLIYEIYDRRTTVLGGGGQKRIRHWLRSLEKPVGIFAEEDVAARILADNCAHLGLAVPDDVAIVAGTYDDIICEMFSPSLSHVLAANEQQGYEAARLLDRLMRGHKPPDKPIQINPLVVSVHESSDTVAVADVRVARAVGLIRNATEPAMQVQDVQDALGMSRTALDNLFRKTLGRTVAEQIRRTRLERAKRLLVTTDWPLARVASRAGFNTAEYLSACFRRELNTSPGAFRKRGRSALSATSRV